MTKLYKKRIFEIADELINLAESRGVLRYLDTDILHLKFLCEQQIIGIETAKEFFGIESETPAECIYRSIVAIADTRKVIEITDVQAKTMRIGLTCFSRVGKYADTVFKNQ